MKSMTGYGSGSAEATAQNLQIEVEITSVNRKTLDAFVSGPREWNGLDQKCTEWLKSSFQRGRVNVQIKVTSTEGVTYGLTWDVQAMDETLGRLKAYSESHGLEFAPDAAVIVDLAKSLKDCSGLPDWTEVEEALKQAFDQALADIDSMRQSEGDSLKQDLLERIDLLDELRAQIETHAAGAVGKQKDALLERLKQLDLDLDTNDERVLKELAIFSDRCDVSEEITRLSSHFEQFRDFLNADEATGRKMDFLCQEIHREFNTTGSKSTQIEITRAVIEGKNTLERIREQVQNVE
ncbi:MAG TPA: YicC family protein [Opitutae bacterium]|nr:YicC family protein [Opitutae bacterium]